MVSDNRPDKVLADVVRTGIETFKSVIEGVTSVIRAGDGTIRDLDSALTGAPAPELNNPEQSFLEVVSLMQAAMEEARAKGTANNPGVVQRSKEILGKVTRAEPAWRPGPALIRTANDVIRISLRDLRASQYLLRLAQGTGTLDDLDNLTKWADDISERIGLTREVIAQPKPSLMPIAPATEPQEAVLVRCPCQTPKPSPRRSETQPQRRRLTPQISPLPRPLPRRWVIPR